MANIKENFRFRVRFRLVLTQLKTEYMDVEKSRW